MPPQSFGDQKNRITVSSRNFSRTTLKWLLFGWKRTGGFYLFFKKWQIVCYYGLCKSSWLSWKRRACNAFDLFGNLYVTDMEHNPLVNPMVFNGLCIWISVAERWLFRANHTRVGPLNQWWVNTPVSSVDWNGPTLVWLTIQRNRISPTEFHFIQHILPASEQV